MSRLGNEGVLEDEEHCGEESCGSAAVETTECQIGERDSGNSKSRREHAHSYIWCVFVEPDEVKQTVRLLSDALGNGDILSDLREIKVTFITKHESRKGDQKFGERGMDVHEISCLDISRGELAKMHFIESGELYTNHQCPVNEFLREEYRAHYTIGF